MKKFIRRLGAIAIALMVGALGASAQSWTGNEPQEGDFYLYNVGSGRFLTSGAWWGTHAVVDYDGMQVTLAAANGGYTISTAIAFAGKYLGDNAYMDNGTAATWVFTQVTPGVYTMKNGNNYLVYTSGCVADLTTTTPTTDAGYWQLVTFDDLVENLKNATPTSPIEASFYMRNPKNRRNWKDSKPYEGTADFNDNGSFNASADGLYTGGCTSVGQWHKDFNNYQALTDLPNGKYTVTVKGNYATPESGWEAIPHLYANSVQTNLIPLGDISGFPGNNDAERNTRALVDDTYLTDPVTVTITDGNLTVGVKSDGNANWCTWREFTIKFLDPELSFAAETLPTTAITANKWYAVTIPTSDDYDITSVAGTTMTYTQDGTQLVSTATTTNTQFTAGETKTIHLEAGVLYLKSSAASTISVSYKYNVGTATSSHTYVQGGETVTITFDATTNDPGATFVKNGNPTITFGGNTVSVTPTSNGFTFTVPAVTAGTDYTLSIPANAFGYEAGSTYNAAQNITIKAPALFDGTYFFKTDADKFWLRGEPYGSAVQVYDWGMPVKVTTNATATTLQFADASDWKIFSDKTGIYADNASPDYGAWSIIKSGTKYIFKVAVDNNDYHYMKVDGTRILSTATEGEATAFTLVTPAEHQAVLTAYVNAQASAAATAANLSASTPAELQTAADGINATTVIEGSTAATTAEKWQGTQWDSRTVYSNTVNVTTPGLYKFTIQGFYRMTDNETTYALHTAKADCPPVYVFFGGAKTPIKSVMDDSRASAYEGNNCDYAQGSNHYPNQQASSLVAFQEGKYVNTVWAYISAAGEYTYGIQYLGWAGSHSEWTCYTTESISLTLYSQDLWGPFQAARSTYAPYNDVAEADDASGYTTQYNTYLTWTEQNHGDLATAITYMQDNYANYQWTNASITHPVEVTEGIITDADCTDNNNWNIGLTGRPTESATDETGTTRILFYQNVEPNAVRGQTVTIPSTGAYMLKTWVRTVDGNANTYAKMAISNGAWNGDGTYANAEDIAAAYGNESTAWRQVTNYFATSTANQQKTIYINLSHGGEGRKAYVSRMSLYYIGQSADFVKDGVHKYIGSFTEAVTLQPTDAVPVIDVTAATFSTAPTVVLTSNPNGLIYAASNANVAGNNVVKGTTCANLSLSDDHPFVVPTEFTASSASYTLSSVADDGTGNKYATLVLPFNATTLAGTAYVLDQGVGISTEVIRGTSVNTIAANQPVLVTAAGTYSGSGTVPAISAGDTFTNGELVGTYTAMTAVERSYVLQKHDGRLAFYIVGTTKKPTVNPFRAYIKPQSADAKMFTVVFDDAVTAIDGINTELNGDAEIFTVGGVRQSNLKRGLNIIRMSDGTVRKVMVK